MLSIMYVCYNVILYFLVTADIDKALLCTDNAVEVALDVREKHKMYNTHTHTHTHTHTNL